MKCGDGICSTAMMMEMMIPVGWGGGERLTEFLGGTFHFFLLGSCFVWFILLGLDFGYCGDSNIAEVARESVNLLFRLVPLVRTYNLFAIDCHPHGRPSHQFYLSSSIVVHWAVEFAACGEDRGGIE